MRYTKCRQEFLETNFNELTLFHLFLMVTPAAPHNGAMCACVEVKYVHECVCLDINVSVDVQVVLLSFPGRTHAVRGRINMAPAEGGSTQTGRTESRVWYPFPPRSTTASRHWALSSSITYCIVGWWLNKLRPLHCQHFICTVLWLIEMSYTLDGWLAFILTDCFEMLRALS